MQEEEEKAKQREPLLNSREDLIEEGKKGVTKDKALKFGWIKGVLVSHSQY